MTTEPLQDIHLCIATPCYGGQVFQNYFTSVIGLITDAAKRGLKVHFIVRGGDSLIPRTRNSIVAEFLANPEWTHLMWIDADIGFSPLSVYRLLLADRDVACGVYPLKKIVWPEGGLPAGTTEAEFRIRHTKYPFNPMPGGEAEIDGHGFLEALDAPTGFMVIKRATLETMMAAYPGLKIIPDAMLGIDKTDRETVNYHYRFFDVMTEASGRYLSEDYAFCRRWQNIGGKVFVDTESTLSHLGHHMYEGHLKSTLLAVSEELNRGADARNPGTP